MRIAHTHEYPHTHPLIRHPQPPPSPSPLRYPYPRYGLTMNIFVGNVIAITQQALWGRSLDYCNVGGGRNIVYSEVTQSWP